MSRSLSADLESLLSLLRSAEDIVAGRPRPGEPPAWVVSRGWETFLSELGDEELSEAEVDPAAWLAACEKTPPSLGALAREATHLTRQYEYQGAARTNEATRAPRQAPRHVKKRKWEQVEALCGVAAARFAGVRRIVDLGAGHGHLTRALESVLEPSDAVGVDWDRNRITRATDLTEASTQSDVRFVHADAAERGLGAQICEHDLVTGLHACGALGDALVTRARAAGAHVLAIGCCYQKTDQPARRPLSAQATKRGFMIPREALGLANLAPISFEGSGSLQSKRASRRTRLALRFALEERGLKLAPGAESHGLTKERVRHGLEGVAPFAFVKRGLSAPTHSELQLARRRSNDAYARLARHALPRHALARPLELAIVLDRARFLEEAGWTTFVTPLFSRGTSPRNLGIVARAGA